MFPLLQINIDIKNWLTNVSNLMDHRAFRFPPDGSA